jgi:hypothetical protein
VLEPPRQPRHGVRVAGTSRASLNAAAALGTNRLEGEAPNHAGCVFEALGVSWKQECRLASAADFGVARASIAGYGESR